MMTGVYTDCRSVFDHLKRDCTVPEDRAVAIASACFRDVCSAGPQRVTQKTEILWVPSRWQLADGLTKPGLEKLFGMFLKMAPTRLHEQSLAALKKRAAVAESPPSIEGEDSSALLV